MSVPGTPAPARGDDRPEHISALEWLVAGLGLVLVLGTLVFLVRDATSDAPRLADIVVRTDSVTAAGGRFLVHFTATNDGRETAADVGIVGELRSGAAGATAETSRATLDYLPGRSTRRGGLTFGTDPRDGTLRLWAEGFQEP